jgi:1-acyl-sn-glycerol-3-phosphate acyltransferase
MFETFTSEVISRSADFCLRLAQAEYFRRIIVVGTPQDDPQQYLLVVANHPYGIQDAFLLKVAYTRPFFFVATAMNFQTRVGDEIKKRPFRGWFLRQCKVLPIVRSRAEGHMSDNVKTFEQAARHIANGHALGIFAEGDSRGNQWNLLKLKAGAAQIALQVAEILHRQHDRLNIQVAGLTYTNWDQPFKSSVTLNFATPFAVEPVDLQDRTAVRTARKNITSRLSDIMRAVTVQIPEEHHGLAGKVAEFYSTEDVNDFDRLRQVGLDVEEAMEHDPQQCKDLERQLDQYLQLANELHVYPGEERSASNPVSGLLLAVPTYIGYMLHLPIIWATRLAIPREKTKLHALGSKRVSWGIVFSLLWYVIVTALALTVTVKSYGRQAVPWVCLAIFTMACCGVLASRKLRQVNLTLRRVAGSARFKRYVHLGEQLTRRLSSIRHQEQSRR